MRVMDGLMSIPAILLAIALVSLASAGLRTVIIAIVIPEVPRVVRLVRSVVLSIREEPYVEAAHRARRAARRALLVRHVLPNTLAPLIVQATFVCASAILIEAILCFLGVGIPPQTPTWGNIMAEGRALFRVFPHNILFPGHLPGRDRARGQHAGRRPARHARPAHAPAALTPAGPLGLGIYTRSTAGRPNMPYGRTNSTAMSTR